MTGVSTINPKRRNPKKKITGAVLFLAAFLSVAAGIDDVGITWDEPMPRFMASELLRQWLGEVVTKVESGSWSSIFEQSFLDKYWPPPTRQSQNQLGTNNHPSLSKVLATLTWFIFHGVTDDFTAYRLSSAILFAGCVVVVFFVMAAQINYATGLFSALSLWLMPRVFGHAHIAATDIPLMAFWLFTVVAFYKGLTRPRWRYVFAGLLGLAWAAKLTALLILLALGLYFLFTRDDRIKRNLLAALFVAPLVFLVLNPTLWNETLKRIYENFIVLPFTREDYTPLTTYYLGQTYVFDLPWHHSFVLTSVTLPAAILLFSLGGILMSVKGLPEKKLTTLFLCQLISLFAVMTLPVAPNHDGVRLFLPVFPFLACFAGVGFNELLKWAGKGGKLFQKWPVPRAKEKLTVALFLLVFVPPAAHLAAVHPYYLESYNIFAGGIKGANRLGFETTYWMDTVTKGVREDIDKIPSFAKIAVYPPYYSYFHYLQQKGLLKKELIFTGERPEFLLLIPRQGMFDEKTWKRYLRGEPIYEAQVDGVPVVLIYHLLQESKK